MNNLGLLLISGEIPVDLPEARNLWKQASELGHPNAMNNLAISYLDGPDSKPMRCGLGTGSLAASLAAGGKMKRREFITAIGGAAAAWPLAGRTQQPPMPVIGYLSARSSDAEEPLRGPFLKALEAAGFSVGRNV